MPAVFEGAGLRFRYPENWHLEESRSEDGWSISLQSPETAFVLINVYEDRPDVKTVLETTLAAMREDYPDLEAVDAVERIARHRAVGHDIQFFSLDLTNSCWTRSFRTARQTVLILCQASDLELEYMEPVLRAIRASLELVE
jgi:hypothetical protein